MRYATKKEMQELTEAVKQLSERMLESSRWATYNILKQTPCIPKEMQKRILEGSKGHVTHFLYSQLFFEREEAASG